MTPKATFRTQFQTVSAAEEKAVLHALEHGRPYGGGEWVATTEKELVMPTLRPPIGRVSTARVLAFEVGAVRSQISDEWK